MERAILVCLKTNPLIKETENELCFLPALGLKYLLISSLRREEITLPDRRKRTCRSWEVGVRGVGKKEGGACGGLKKAEDSCTLM